MTSDSSFSTILTTNTDLNLNLEDLDLNNCDREPIHIPNLIQPHGLLIAIAADSYEILQVSLNTESMLGIKPNDLVGKPLAELLGEQIEAIKQCLDQSFDSINPVPLELSKDKSKLYFNGIVHCQDSTIIIELEPSSPAQKADFTDFYRLIKSPVSRIQQTNTLDELCQTIAQEIHAITQFDRVMVYRFEPEGSGTVIAEAAVATLEPFLGLRYPATDIPKQAKYLYTLNHLRLIPDAAYEPVGMMPQCNPLTNKPLDMSMSVLRSVSPLHTEYLSNMGVTASMSISLLKNKQLWGLISCHHHTPKQVAYEIRTVCEFIGQIASFELVAKEESQNADYKIKLKSIQSQFVKIISQAEDLELVLTQNPQLLLDLVGAKGVALVFDGEITLLGQTPQLGVISKMLPWLKNQFDQDIIYETNALSQEYAAAACDHATASGILALQVSQVQRTFIIWFRPEVIQTVNWGGDPHKITEVDADGTVRMSPRKSFAKWQETVRGKSLPWKKCEVEAALELRSLIVGIVLQKADELAQLNKELSRSNIELDAFAYIASHDLKEPLRGIYNYSSFLIEDYGETLGEDGKDKLDTLMRLTHRMEDLINSLLHYSRLGRSELRRKPTDINNLLEEVLDVIKASARDTKVEFKIPRPLPEIECDRTQVNELFTNLISNGIKYNQNVAKVVEVGYLDATDCKSARQAEAKSTIFYVRDNGIGIRDRHLDSIFRIFKRLHAQKKYGGGTGAGLTIAKKIVERHGGEIWVESVYQEGSTFYFTLPYVPQ